MNLSRTRYTRFGSAPGPPHEIIFCELLKPRPDGSLRSGIVDVVDVLVVEISRCQLFFLVEDLEDETLLGSE